jgi:hypothetical protein
MVRIDIDDQDIIEPALLRLLPGMREQAAGIELFDGNAAAAIGNQVHGVSSGCGAQLEEEPRSFSEDSE